MARIIVSVGKAAARVSRRKPYAGRGFRVKHAGFPAPAPRRNMARRRAKGPARPMDAISISDGRRRLRGQIRRSVERAGHASGSAASRQARRRGNIWER